MGGRSSSRGRRRSRIKHTPRVKGIERRKYMTATRQVKLSLLSPFFQAPCGCDSSSRTCTYTRTHAAPRTYACTHIRTRGMHAAPRQEPHAHAAAWHACTRAAQRAWQAAARTQQHAREQQHARSSPMHARTHARTHGSTHARQHARSSRDPDEQARCAKRKCKVESTTRKANGKTIGEASTLNAKGIERQEEGRGGPRLAPSPQHKQHDVARRGAPIDRKGGGFHPCPSPRPSPPPPPSMHRLPLWLARPFSPSPPPM